MVTQLCRRQACAVLECPWPPGNAQKQESCRDRLITGIPPSRGSCPPHPTPLLPRFCLYGLLPPENSPSCSQLSVTCSPSTLHPAPSSVHFLGHWQPQTTLVAATTFFRPKSLAHDSTSAWHFPKHGTWPQDHKNAQACGDFFYKVLGAQ